MATHRISATAEIAAPAERVYAILADYRNGHPHILPKPYFQGLRVVEGGIGAGTVVEFSMRLLGSTRRFRATVSEPEPGRVLVETNDDGAVTRFTVEPRGAARCRVTIATETTVRDGWPGKIEGWMTTRLLRPIYEKELAEIAAFARRLGQ